MTTISNNSSAKQNCMIAYIFDGGKFSTPFYGKEAIKTIVQGKELQDNQSKIIFSVEDIINNEACVDISPFVIFDDLCSIGWETNGDLETQGEESYLIAKGMKDYPYAVVLEDIEKDIAKRIDVRIQKECAAYIGLTTIDIESEDLRKQFWKSAIRSFSLEGKTCTVFGEKEYGFSFEEEVKAAGYSINFDGFAYGEVETETYLKSTRQSSFIQKTKQLMTVEGVNDSDRGLLNMNFALVKEVEIAGVLIWKAIEDINRVYLAKDCKYTLVDYVFTSFYHAAQGIERLLKILVELVAYMNKNIEKKKTDDLLLSHKHIALLDYLVMKQILQFDKPSRNLLYILSEFYNKARYHRYADSTDDKLELSLLKTLGSSIREENFDEEFKKMYGKILGKISRKTYRAIDELSSKLNIYVYELHPSSVARIVFGNVNQENLYVSLLKYERAKKEILWYLICNGKQIQDKYPGIAFPALSFEDFGLNEFIESIIKDKLPETEADLYICDEYDKLRTQDKDKLKERLDFLDYLFSNEGWEDHFIPDDDDDEN